MRLMLCEFVCRQARFPARPRFGQCKLSTNWNRIVVGRMPGAVGYVDYSGNMDTCIALRTIVIPQPGKTAFLQAGAGIVADSQPEMEWKETLNKARGCSKRLRLPSSGRKINSYYVRITKEIDPSFFVGKILMSFFYI